MPKLAPPSPAAEAGGAAPEPNGRAVFRTAKGLERLPTLFCERDDLPVDRPIAGPAVIAQLDATTVVPPGATIVRDRAVDIGP